MVKSVAEMTVIEKEELLKKISKELKDTLSETRYLHSVSTMKKAKELAKEYHQEEYIVMLTALAHDIAKEMTLEQYLAYAKKNEIILDDFDKTETTMLHGKIGANIVAKKYGFTKEMQDAIYYHTTGRAGMTLLDKIIFLADKSEDKREGPEAEELRTEIKEQGLDQAILWDIENAIIPKMIAKQRLIHPNSIEARNDIVKKERK